MTAVGKILVFLNLVFSLVVGAFVIMIYLARTHWVDEYNKLGAQNKVLAASEATYKTEAVKAQQDADAKVAKALADLKNVQADLQAEVTLNTQIKKDLEDLKKKSTQQNAVASLSMVEVQKRQEDVAKLRDTLKKETDLNVELVKSNNQLRDVAQAATIQRQSVQEQNNRLEAQLQTMARDMARMKAGGGATTVRAGGKNPPPESVEGLVKTTDPSGLMTITIGSDAGLKKDHTLELFRLNPSSPTQSKYLGTVRVLEATATQAVVQPMTRLTAPPQPGDRVASRILGS
jgi:uncharacterized protein (DUF2164 family)